MRGRAVGVLSGGLDSTVAMLEAQATGYQVVRAITFDYNQRAGTKEIECASRLCEWIGVPHQVVDFKELGDVGNSALTNPGIDAPTVEYGDLDNFDLCREVAKAVWVPNRNGIFTNICAAWAEAGNCQYLVVGFNAEEALVYPDNTLDYINALNKAFSYSTANKVEVISPTYGLNKAQIAQALVDHELGPEYIWPCHHGGGKWCGRCESCRRTIRAFESIGQAGYVEGAYYA